MSKSLVDTCIYETDWSIKLLPYTNITNISTDVTNISTDIDTDNNNIGKSIEFYRYPILLISVPLLILISVHL